MPLPRLIYLFERTSKRPQGLVAYFLRFFPYTFLLLGVLVSRLADASWMFLAGGAIFIALVYPCRWAEVKLRDSHRANASPQDAL